jgi:hypothetical protein
MKPVIHSGKNAELVDVKTGGTYRYSHVLRQSASEIRMLCVCPSVCMCVCPYVPPPPLHLLNKLTDF